MYYFSVLSKAIPVLIGGIFVSVYGCLTAKKALIGYTFYFAVGPKLF